MIPGLLIMVYISMTSILNFAPEVNSFILKLIAVIFFLRNHVSPFTLDDFDQWILDGSFGWI